MSSDTKTTIALTLACAAFLLALWVGLSALEASAFNRATGKSISTWDAMFVTLRVQGEATE